MKRLAAGNNFGIAGMAIALIATIFGPDTGNVGWILLAMVIGGGNWYPSGEES